MKRQVSNSGVAMVLSLLFMLGGLFIANDVQAQAHNLLQTQQPVTNWISPQQAMPVAAVEVENLTAKVQQLVNNGADTETLRKAKTELLFYYTMLNSLQQGTGTKESFELAWNTTGLGVDAGTPLFTPSEVEALYNSALGKFTD
jgi:hypothetical protein